MINDVDRNYNYFEKNIQELRKKYLGEYVLIYNENVEGHNENLDKVLEIAKALEPGTYIVKKCEKEDEIQMFHSRVMC